jgi:peptide/nickel transport system permease protein
MNKEIPDKKKQKKQEVKQPTGDSVGSFEPVSQWRLIWRRFKHHKMGLVGTGLILTFFLVFIGLSDFVAPYYYGNEHRDFGYVPPMFSKIRFWDKDGNFSFKPFVYGLGKCQLYLNPLTNEQTCDDNPAYHFQPGQFRWLEDTNYKCNIELFVRGEPYRFWNLWRTDIHLFGVRQEGVPFDPYTIDKSPCQLFLFGSDKLGYDILSMTLVGGKISLIIGPIVIVIAFIVGILLGGISGYYGGGIDTFIQRVIEIFMALPRLALLLALSLILSANKLYGMATFWGIVVILAIVSWAPLARVIRGQFLALRESEFIAAAQAVGVGDLRIIFKHVLPNIMSYLVVASTLTIPNLIILESTLSFLRLGIRAPLTSWGVLMQEAWFTSVIQNYPWFLIPGIFIVLSVLAFNFMGDALRDAVDPFTVTGAKEEPT